jgi:hypothetical protein
MQTAAASTGTNVSTAVANAFLGNVNQNTPFGNLTYDQTGTYSWNDPTTDKTYDIPTFTATQTLNETGQGIQNLLGGALGNVQGAISNPVDISGAPNAANPGSIGLPQYQQFGAEPQLQTGIQGAGGIQSGFGEAGDITRSYTDDFSADRQRVEDALMTRLQTQIDRDRESQASRLANQGIRMGSTAFSAAEDDFNRGVTDARLGAILAGGQEQSRLAGLSQQQAMFGNQAQQQQYSQNLGRAAFGNEAQAQGFGQNLAAADFGNQAQQQMFNNQMTSTGANNALQDQSFNAQMAQMQAQNAARNQSLQEQFALRNQPLNELSALLSGGQVNQPSFVNANMPNIPTTDVAGIINQNFAQQQGNAQMRNQATNSLMGGLFGLGSAGIMKYSDRRLKDNVREIGQTKDGQPLYSYTYKGDSTPQIGLMAQDVEKTNPDAVIDGPGGFKMVDYNRALGSVMRA